MGVSAIESVRRLGVLVGESDPLVEFDLQRFLPHNVSFHIGRLDMPTGARLASNETSQMLCDAAPGAARRVAAAEVEFIIFACTSASFLHGEGWDLELARQIEDASGVAATTTATAVADALEFMDARRVFMATPYSPEVNAREVAFIASRGIEVTQQFSFGCALSRDVAHVSPAVIYDELMRRRAEIRGNDVLFVSCTMLRAMEIAEQLEADIGVPVVTSNSASVWRMLNAVGEDTGPVKAGRLFRQASPEGSGPTPAAG